MYRNRHANPYRLYANHEISLSNHARATAIFLLGAEAVLKSLGEFHDDSKGLSALFYDWGRFEKDHMKNAKRAKVLLDEALRLTTPNDSELRSNILYNMGELEFQDKKYYIAKHFACLSINESEINGSKEAWTLWANVAKRLGQDKLEQTCLTQAKIQGKKQMKLWTDDESLSPSQLLKDSNLKDMLGKTPWNRKLFYDNMKDRSFVGKAD